MTSAAVGESEVAAFVQEGYLVVPGLLRDDEVAEINGEIVAFARGEHPALNPEVLAGPGATDDEAVRTLLAVHFPHWVDPVIDRYVRHPGVVDVLRRIVGAHLPWWDGRVKCMQSMLFVKPPGMPGQAWHQDEHYIPTRDRSLCGAWMALDDATVENGCLWVVPGSHRTGELLPTAPHDQPDEYDGASMAQGVDETAAVPVEVRAGDVVFFNGHLLHRSLANRSTSTWRRALVNHYCNGWSELPWDPTGGVAAQDYRMITMVAGDDPYAWKGTPEPPRVVWIRPRGG